jgi:hypothetical protein
MEIDSFVGTKLNEIQKKPDEVKLVFENSKTHKKIVLSFRGLLFETSASTLNKKVVNIKLAKTLGIRAMSQLRHLHRDPDNYSQLFIEMEGSDTNNKIELLGVVRSIKVTARTKSAAKVPSKKVVVVRRK